MRANMRGTIARFAAFVVVCLTGAFVLFAVFAQLRFDKQPVYKAEFTDVSGLKDGDFVRIAGVEVGTIQKISVTRTGLAVVEFSADPSVVLTDGTKAALRWADPLGTRYLALREGPGDIKRLNPGQTIPVSRTEPALDIDTLLGGFRPLFRALNPQQVNALSSQLINAFQDQGPAIGSFLTQAAAVTNTLADRDELVGQVITNLNVVLGSLGGENKQFAKAVDTLSQLVQALSQHKTEISNAVAYTNASSATIADLLQQARPPLANAIHQTDRSAAIVVGDHSYVENLIDTLPDAYKALARQGIYGDFFNFYMCDVLLKFNGKGGQPVYVKVAGQTSGRCAPK